VADEVPRVADAPDLQPLLPRTVSGVEADLLIIMEAPWIGGVTVMHDPMAEPAQE
jgi:hypothetical protein